MCEYFKENIKFEDFILFFHTYYVVSCFCHISLPGTTLNRSEESVLSFPIPNLRLDDLILAVVFENVFDHIEAFFHTIPWLIFLI